MGDPDEWIPALAWLRLSNWPLGAGVNPWFREDLSLSLPFFPSFFLVCVCDCLSNKYQNLEKIAITLFRGWIMLINIAIIYCILKCNSMFQSSVEYFLHGWNTFLAMRSQLHLSQVLFPHKCFFFVSTFWVLPRWNWNIFRKIKNCISRWIFWFQNLGVWKYWGCWVAWLFGDFVFFLVFSCRCFTS